jgi:2-C-methyl-D-erythritol 4-phosphate cytidylyltransferase
MTPADHRPRATAVVLAGGTGQRMGLALPKQLLKVAGKTVLEHTLHVFEAAEEIGDVWVLMTPDYLAEAEALVRRAGLRKVRAVLPGGATRAETTQRAIAALRADDPADRPVLFHDAVRPLLSQRVVADCVRALERYEAVDVAIPSADTIIVTRTHGEDGEFITDVPDRSRLRRGQTPQGFRLDTIERAYLAASRDPNFQTTDDCSVVLRYLPEVPIHVVPGEEHNLKITKPVDVHLADRLFQLATQTAPPLDGPQAYADRLAGRTMVVFGGSYGIGAEIARLARSHGAEVYAHGRTSTGVHVESTEAVERTLAEAAELSGRIDFVVNTAGLLRIGALADCDEAGILEATGVNYLAPLWIARAAHRHLAAQRGQLLLYTSSSYTRGRADYALYSSAKAAVVNLTQALADEWAADGIRVNCMNPERTGTPMRLNAFGHEPPATLLSAEDVARSSLDVLLSGLTGQVVDVRLPQSGGELPQQSAQQAEQQAEQQSQQQPAQQPARAR